MDIIPCLGEVFTASGSGRFLFTKAQDAADVLLRDYHGRAQIIYLDPPFGTGDTFAARLGQHGKKIKVPAYADDLSHDAYLGMMREVLVLCHDLLSPTGCLYLHIDHRMSAHLRLLLDEIFGPQNFVNEIIWSYRSGGRSVRYFSRKHDNILLYRKSRAMYFNIRAVGKLRGSQRRNHMKRLVDADGKISYSIRSGGKEYVYHEDSLIYPGDVWDDIEHLHQRDPERTGYSTQKPEALLTRIIQASSRPGDLIMDLFCGSGTTAATAAKLGRPWVVVDTSPVALQVLRKRLLLSQKQIDLFSKPAEVRMEYLQPPPKASPPVLKIEQQGHELQVSPSEGSLAYLALGEVREGFFHPLAFDLDPVPGRILNAPARAHAVQAVDIFGASGVWEL